MDVLKYQEPYFDYPLRDEPISHIEAIKALASMREELMVVWVDVSFFSFFFSKDETKKRHYYDAREIADIWISYDGGIVIHPDQGRVMTRATPTELEHAWRY